MRFEGVKIKNGVSMIVGRVYRLYILDQDIYTGPTELWASEIEQDKPLYCRAVVYGTTAKTRRARRVKEDYHVGEA